MDSSLTRSAVVLDPHPLWLDAVEGVLARIDVTVVGKATSPEAALELVTECQPDLFIVEIDARSSELDSVACMRLARQFRPGLKLLVLSSVDDQQRVDAAFSVGALAYVVKTARADDLSAAVRQAFEPSVYFSYGRRQETAAASLRTHGSAAGNGSDRNAPKGLTRRELEILQLVAEGYSSSTVARILWVTEQTVKFHLSNIYRKLGVSNRTEASRWAQLHHVLREPSQVSSG
jgi:two-component system response regulator DevR